MISFAIWFYSIIAFDIFLDIMLISNQNCVTYT